MWSCSAGSPRIRSPSSSCRSSTRPCPPTEQACSWSCTTCSCWRCSPDSCRNRNWRCRSTPWNRPGSSPLPGRSRLNRERSRRNGRWGWFSGRPQTQNFDCWLLPLSSAPSNTAGRTAPRSIGTSRRPPAPPTGLRLSTQIYLPLIPPPRSYYN